MYVLDPTHHFMTLGLITIHKTFAIYLKYENPPPWTPRSPSVVIVISVSPSITWLFASHLTRGLSKKKTQSRLQNI